MVDFFMLFWFPIWFLLHSLYNNLNWAKRGFLFVGLVFVLLKWIVNLIQKKIDELLLKKRKYFLNAHLNQSFEAEFS